MSLDSLSIPMTMGDWVLIMESITTELQQMEQLAESEQDDDKLAELYDDQQNLEGILRYIKIEFQKEYGSLPEIFQ